MKYLFLNIVNYICILYLCISIYYFVFKYKKTNLSDQSLLSYLELFVMTDNTNNMQHPELSQAVSTQNNAALQVMSPDADKHQFTTLLSGPQNFKAWYKEFTTVVEIYYPALHFHILDDENTVYDKNLQVLTHPNYKKMMLSNYKSIVTNLFSRSLSKHIFQTFQFNFQQIFDDPNFAKLALYYTQT